MHEARFIQQIIKEIANKLNRTILSLPPYQIGIDSRVEEINSWLQDGSADVGIVTICGIGKTTIAKIVYNLNFDRFEASSFLANIREISEQHNGLVCLQRRLLQDILKGKQKKICSVHEDFTITVLDGCDFYTEVGIDNLIDRCLLIIDQKNKLMMHQLLQDMAREIVRQESTEEPEKRSRLWHHKDAFNVLIEKTGTETVEGLILNMNGFNEEEPSRRVNNSKRHHSEYFHGNSSFLYKGSSSSSKRRRLSFSWLSMNSSSTESFPTSKEVNIHTDAFSRMQRLRILQLYNVWLTGYYEEFPKKLRWLCWHGFPLKSILNDFSLESLVALDVSYSNLERVWNGTKLNELPTELGKMESLKVFEADETAIHQSLSIIGEEKSWGSVLRSWMLTPRKSPTSIRFSLASLSRSLVSLSLEDCNLSDDAIPKDLGGMSLLQHLDLNKNPICNLPDNIRGLTALQKLELAHCTKLHSLPELPMSLNNLNIHKCSSLEMVTNLPNLLRSLVLAITSCDSLVEIQGLFKLVPIKNINAEMLNNMGWFNLEAMGKVEVTLFNVMTIRTVKVPRQGLYEFIIFNTFLPGNEVPSWFSNKSTGSSICLNVPSLPNLKIRGLNVCVVYEQTYAKYDDRRNEYWDNIFIRTSNKTKGFKWIYSPTFVGLPKDNEHMIWLSHWKIGNQLEGGDEVDVTVFLWAYMKLKEFGIQVVYEQEENNTQQGDLYPSFHNVVNEDLSSYQFSTGMYLLCHHDFDIYQDCSKSGGWTSKVCSPAGIEPKKPPLPILTFTDHLCTALVHAGFRTFKDDDDIERGENIKFELQKAIQGSRISIVVFSKDYASSSWCLDELVMILKRRKTTGHVVLPIVYHIDPSHVRKQMGSFKEAFTCYEERFQTERSERRVEWMVKVEKWKAALEKLQI
ncbi:unnamed protein product [Camellia sinensis]